MTLRQQSFVDTKKCKVIRTDRLCAAFGGMQNTIIESVHCMRQMLHIVCAYNVHTWLLAVLMHKYAAFVCAAVCDVCVCVCVSREPAHVTQMVTAMHGFRIRDTCMLLLH